MNNATHDTWNPGFLAVHPLFWPLVPFAKTFVQSHAQWPALDDYQQYLDSGVGQLVSGNNKLLRFVPQGGKPQRFEEGYEPRIYLEGEIQTRLHNWHDFFQVMVWRMFPKTKTVINERHYLAIKQRLENSAGNQQRSPMENALTQFDECGAVIVSSDPELLELITHFRWKALFWQHRDAVKQHLKCIVFGHAIYEKALNPYTGMTAHSVLLPVPAPLLEHSTTALIAAIDEQLEKLFVNGKTITAPADFAPFPLLGIPGWDAENEHESYYDNTHYFRPGRKYKT
ncbi:DUF3025 domain-containing protein [Kaarinaea lacus]